MNYLTRVCRDEMMVSMMRIAHRRELDKMELDRRSMAKQMQFARRSLKRRVSGLEKDSNNTRLAVTERIDAVWEQLMRFDNRLNLISRTSLEELKERVSALEGGVNNSYLLARIEDLQTLLTEEKAELDRVKLAYGELDTQYVHLKAAVAGARSIEDLGWVQI